MTADNDNELPRTRAEARTLGGKHYFTGEPCKHGHVSWRYTRDGRCSECTRLKSLEAFYADRDARTTKAREYLRTRYAEDAEYRESRKEYQRVYKSDPHNAEKIRIREQERRDNRSEEERMRLRDYARDYQRNRHQRSPQARINRSMAGGIYKSIRGAKDGQKWEALAGYSIADLMSHLEMQFLPGMTWDNYGKRGWHIDHKKPKASFSYETTDDQQFKECWSLENLQPLWWRDNISKGAKLVADNDKHHTAPLQETA